MGVEGLRLFWTVITVPLKWAAPFCGRIFWFKGYNGLYNLPDFCIPLNPDLSSISGSKLVNGSIVSKTGVWREVNLCPEKGLK